MATKKNLTPIKQDGWENLLTGLNDLSRDPRRQATSYARLMGYDEARVLYRGDDMAANVIDTPADDMTRKGWRVRCPDEVDTSEAIEGEFKRLHTANRVKDAIRWMRAYGGSGILIGVNDGAGLNDLINPVNENAIRSVDYLTTLDARELQVVRYYSNPLDEKFGQPEIYRINPWALGSPTIGLVEVHESRILRFCMPVSARVDLVFNFGWGDSVLAKMYEVLRDFGLSWSSASALLGDFAVAIYKIRGLKEAIASNRSDLVIQRFKLMDMAKSILRGIVLDADGEDFERKSTTLAGLADLLDRICNRLAAAARMPVTKLIGQAPAGLNATGKGDQDNWDDMVAAQQKEFIEQPLLYLAKLICLAGQGPINAALPDNTAIEFEPLRQQSALEQAQTQQAAASADAQWVSSGVLSPEEISQSRFGGDKFGMMVHLDQEARAAFAAVDPTDPNMRAQTPRLDPEQTKGGDNGENTPKVSTSNAAGGVGVGKPAPPAEDQPGAQRPAPLTFAGPKAPPAMGKPADNSLQGNQVSAAHEIVESVTNKKIPRESGVAMLQHLIGLTPEQADQIMAGAGKDFEPKPPDPVVLPAANTATEPGKPPAVQKGSDNEDPKKAKAAK